MEEEIKENPETLVNQAVHKAIKLSIKGKRRIGRQKVVTVTTSTKREKVEPLKPFPCKGYARSLFKSQTITTTVTSNNKLNVILYTYEECKYIGMTVHSKAGQQASKCRHTKTSEATPPDQGHTSAAVGP